MVLGINTPQEESSQYCQNFHLKPEVSDEEKKTCGENIDAFLENHEPHSLKPLKASRLRYTKTTTPMSVPELDSPIIQSQSQSTDHMITVIWNVTTGWSDPELGPYSNFSISPTTSCLHYATQCFEGLKMFRGYDGSLRLFRPYENCKRLLLSANRIALPSFDAQEVEKLIFALAAIDGPKWLPKSRPGNCVYLRPCIIGSDAALGVATPNKAILFIIAILMPQSVFANGLKLLANDKIVRAWPGGHGYAKIGANYGPCLQATLEANKRGFHQVLWLFDDIVTEAGASNFFVIWKAPETAKSQLITAPINEKNLILNGITRRSILDLVRKRLSSSYRRNQESGSEEQIIFGPLEIVERDFSMDELVRALNEGRLLEAFASGTAYFVCPVYTINYKNQDYQILTTRGSGSYTELFKTWLTDINYGREKHEWAIVVKEEETDEKFI